MTLPVAPAHGNVALTGELWVADVRGRLLRNISDRCLQGTVRIRWDDDVSWSLDCSVEGHDVVQAVTEWLVPILRVGWRDDTGTYRSVARRLGHFMHFPSPKTHERGRTVTEVEGFSAEYMLSQLTANRMITITPGVFCGRAAEILLADHGDVRLAIPATPLRTGKTRTVMPSEDLLPRANEVLHAAGYTKLTADADGVIRPWPWPNLSTTEVTRWISSANGDVFGEVGLDPDGEAFCNRVILRSTDTDADITMKSGYQITNTDPASDYSVHKLGWVKTAEISDDTDLSYDTMRRRAHYLLSRGTSMLARVRLDVLPDPRVVPFAVWSFDVRQDDGTPVLQGRWRVEEMAFGFTPGQERQQVTVSKLANITWVD